MNLCRCGKLGDPRAECRCSPDQVRKYQERVSGPLLDRIDIQVHVKPVPHERLAGEAESSTTTSIMRRRVLDARATQQNRQGTCNAVLQGARLEQVCAIGANAHDLLRQAMDKLSLSARGYHRILRVARTIADLDGASAIDATHVAEAIQFRALDTR
jgi:magnesium chelatase family protein